MQAIGVDIGGTKISACVVTSAGDLSTPVQVPSRAGEGPQAVLEQCVQAIDAARVGARQRHTVGIGIASAGRIDPVTGTVLFSTSTFRDWAGTPIAQEVARRTGLPVRVDNDVNAALLGEAWIGAARGLQRAAFVALGTGVGGALLEDAKVVRGAHNSAGEFGHMIFQAQGRPCPCGARGCYEAYLAGPALQARYREATGRDVPAWQIMEDAAAGDACAQVALAEWVDCLAALLFTLQNGFDPDQILLGGGVAMSAEHFVPALAQALAQYPVPVTVELAALGNRAALAGAARMALMSPSG